MFVEASALLAMLSDEDDARLLAARLQGARARLTSPIAVFETAAGVAALYGLAPEEAEAEVARFLELMGIQILSLPAQVTPLALAAHARFGPGAPRGETGAPQDGLTLADCFAYACARYFRQPLLYKAARFSRTDIETG